MVIGSNFVHLDEMWKYLKLEVLSLIQLFETLPPSVQQKDYKITKQDYSMTHSDS